MSWLRRFSEKAKGIEAEAGALIAAYGLEAGRIARERERNANDLGGSRYWRAVRKAVAAAKAGDAAICLPVERERNCFDCLVEVLSGRRDPDAPSLPVACLACIARQLRWGALMSNEGAPAFRSDWTA